MNGISTFLQGTVKIFADQTSQMIRTNFMSSRVRGNANNLWGPRISEWRTHSVAVGGAYLGHEQGAGVDDVNEVPQTAEEGTLQKDHSTTHQVCFFIQKPSAQWPLILYTLYFIILQNTGVKCAYICRSIYFMAN